MKAALIFFFALFSTQISYAMEEQEEIRQKRLKYFELKEQPKEQKEIQIIVDPEIEELKTKVEIYREQEQQEQQERSDRACKTVIEAFPRNAKAATELCDKIRPLSLPSMLLIDTKINSNEILSATQKVKLFRLVIEDDEEIVKVQEKKGKLEYIYKTVKGEEDPGQISRKNLIEAIHSHIYKAMKQEEKIAEIMAAMRKFTNPDTFMTGIAGRSTGIKPDILKQIKEYFVFCTELTVPLIDKDMITDDFIRFGFVGAVQYYFYDLVSVLENAMEIKLPAVEKQMQYKFKLTERWEKEQQEEGKEQEIKKYFQRTVTGMDIEEEIIPPEVVRAFIKLFLAECFSRALIMDIVSEEGKRNSFFQYFTSDNPIQDQKWQNKRDFILEPAAEGSFRALLLSFQNRELFGGAGNTIKPEVIDNFKRLTKLLFSILTVQERRGWRNFFYHVLKKFLEPLNEVDLLLQYQELLIPHLLEAVAEPLPPAEPISLKTKFVIAAAILSGSILGALWLKKNQFMFQRYPFLAKLFPFLYQQPVQKTQKWFGRQ